MGETFYDKSGLKTQVLFGKILMREQFTAKQNSYNSDGLNAQRYMSKYAKELQLHFNLSDEELKKVISNVYSSIKSESPIQKWLNMIKLWR